MAIVYSPSGSDMTPSLRISLSWAALTLLLVAPPNTAHAQYRAPATVGIQAMSAAHETAPPKLPRSKFPDHRIEGAVVGGTLGIGFLLLIHLWDTSDSGTRKTRLVDSPILFPVFLTGLGAFIGSTISKDP